jgi:tetratricopeptide (TPR) repeat protein
VGNWFANLNRPDEALTYHQQAITLLQGLDDRRRMAETWDLLGTTTLISGDSQGAADYYAQAITLFAELGDLPGQTSSLTMRSLRGGAYFTSTLVPAPGGGQAGLADGEAACALAAQIDQPGALALARLIWASSLGFAGRYTEALDLAGQAMAGALDLGHLHFESTAHFVFGSLFLDLKAPDRAVPHLERALALTEITGSLFLRGMAAGWLGRAYLALNSLDQARAVLAPLQATGLPLRLLPLRAVATTTVALMLACDDAPAALAQLEALEADTPHLATAGLATVPHLAGLHGAVLAALDRPAEAITLLEAAVEAARAQGAWSRVWRLHKQLAHLYRKQGRPGEAAEAAAQAAAVIEDLACSVPEHLSDDPAGPNLRESFRAAALRL